MPVDFDLVVPTLGRSAELDRFLGALEAQSYRSYRLIVVVDQDAEAGLEPTLAPYRDKISIQQVESARGLSRARNAGLREVTGDVVSFPDDDCWYPPDLLQRVADILERNPAWDGVTGRTIDESARSSLLLWQKQPGLITRENVWRTAVTVTIFLRRAVVERVGSFDETLSLGAGTKTWCLFLALRWLSGVVGVLGLTWLTWQTLKIPNTQSATGILYASVVLTFIGELVSELLSAGARYPV